MIDSDIASFNQIKTPHLLQKTKDKRDEIRHYFVNTYSLYEQLFDTLHDVSAFYQKADPLRHPLIFYYGHTAVFFINKLLLAGLIDKRVDARLESMLAIGVDEMVWDDIDDKNYQWPTVKEVTAYREKVRAIVIALIDSMDISLPIDWDSPAWVILMGIEHERIHLETSSVLIRQLPLDMVKPHASWPICQETASAPNNSLIAVPKKTVTMGKAYTHPLYGWDNEYGEHLESVDAFKASQYLVSNQEFLAFIEAGGYKTEHYWTEEGWQWRCFENTQLPRFWRDKGNNQYLLRTMLEEISMPWDWPCEVNYYEAKAFCNWLSEKTSKSIRLPSEAEWCVLRGFVEGDFDSWTSAPGNIDLNDYASSVPVNQHAFGAFYDIIGNVWQWTETAMNCFDGFRVHPLYDDFSTPTFDNKHLLIKGGSWISTGNEATRHARYAFRKHFYQHAGFRYVESEKEIVNTVDVYETDALVAQYMDFHFGPEHFGVENFTKKISNLCLNLPVKKGRAMDLGCAVGRASFELGKAFEYVLGIDFSARFIKIATQMKEMGHAKYQISSEGELLDYYQILLSDAVALSSTDHISFAQGDACNLSKKYGTFDLILALNLIDRLSKPKKFLLDIEHFINPQGYLVIASPYTWLPEFTAKADWLGGFRDSTGEKVTTLEGLKQLLSPKFTLVQAPQDVAFVIRETGRKFQHTLSQLTIWQYQG